MAVEQKRLQADLRTFGSGVYDYDLTTGLLQLNNGLLSGATTTDSGKFIHVNTVDSLFGSGWGLAGIQQLVENEDGSALLIDGDGSELWFESSDNAATLYGLQVGDFSTLERLANGTFVVL